MQVTCKNTINKKQLKDKALNQSLSWSVFSTGMSCMAVKITGSVVAEGRTRSINVLTMLATPPRIELKIFPHLMQLSFMGGISTKMTSQQKGKLFLKSHSICNFLPTFQISTSILHLPNPGVCSLPWQHAYPRLEWIFQPDHDLPHRFWHIHAVWTSRQQNHTNCTQARAVEIPPGLSPTLSH